MIKRQTVKELVPITTKAMTHYPETKDSYEALFSLVIEKYYAKYRPELLTPEVITFLKDFSKQPPFKIETLNRAKRLSLEKDPTLNTPATLRRRKLARAVGHWNS